MHETYIISNTVTDSSNITGAQNIGGRDILVLGLRRDVVAVAVSKEGLCSHVGRDVGLENLRASGGVAVALTPAGNRGGTAGEDGVTTGAGDGNGDVVQNDVLEDETTSGIGNGRGRTSGDDTLIGVRDRTVQNRDGADVERLAIVTSGQINTCSTVVDRESDVGPSPVPDLDDGSLAVVEGEVLHGVLLVAHRRSRSTTVEGEIAHEPTGTALDEQTNVDRVVAFRHVELDVDQTRRLRAGPVHTGRRRAWSNVGGVDDKVADLAEEDVDGNPVGVLSIVGVSIDQAEAGEVRSGLQDRAVCRVTDHLCVIRSDNRRRDQVGSSREVDHCRGLRFGSLVKSVTSSEA